MENLVENSFLIHSMRFMFYCFFRCCCKQVVYDVNNMTVEIKQRMKNYDVRAVPTTIIDGEIKVVGIPEFPWICGEDLYKKLKAEYSMHRV